MKIAITGGTGFVGRNIARTLVGQGHQVVLIARGLDHTDPNVRQLARARIIPIGVDDADKLAEAFAGCDAVAHCAGINREIGAQTYQRVHIHGTRNVVAAAERAGVRRILLISFLRARPNCGSGYHESKFAAEEIVRNSGLDYTILKCGVIYGRGDHMLDHLSHAFHTFPIFGFVGFRDQPIRPNAVEDVVRIAVASLVGGELSRRTVAVMGPETLTLRQAVLRVAGVVGRRPLAFPLPVWFHYCLGWFVERIMRVPLVSTAQVRMLAEGLAEPCPACDPVPPGLASRIPFTEERIRNGLPPAGPFRLHDLRGCEPDGYFVRLLAPLAPLRALLAILVTIAILLPVIWIGTSLLKDYGWTLFVIVPYCLGLLPGLTLGPVVHRTLGRRILTGLIGLLLLALLLLILAFEGAICLAMAAPLAAPLTILGSLSAHAILKFLCGPIRPGRLYCAAVLVLPFCLGMEHWQRRPPPLLMVQSSVNINAPPEIVWRHVVTFSELPPTKEWLFHSGIAYPIRAEIQGQGRGAVRYCVFSTGPFVEPIEVWDEPRLLKFSVTENPPPMKEFSPYRDLHPPHLDGFFTSERGQFLLVRLPDGRTRLEGTTWYHHGLWPAGYWQLWSDYIIHRIHIRVLNHVKQLSETESGK